MPRSRSVTLGLLLSLLLVVSLTSTSEFGSGADAFVAEATEIISVVRIGVSLVEYIYKTFAFVFEDSGASKVDWTGEEGREMDAKLLQEYTKVTAALDRLAQSNEHVEYTIQQLQRNLPQIVR